LGENGIVVAQGIGRLRQALPSLLEDPDNRLSGLFREMLGEMAERLRWLDDRCRRYEQRIEQLFRTDERAQRLGQIEGVGPFAAPHCSPRLATHASSRAVENWPPGLGWYRVVSIRAEAATSYAG
jgi:hypothetical protein